MHQQFLSATEVSGSNGSQFAVDTGDRAAAIVDGTVFSSASDPDVFFDGTQYVMYISHGTNVTVWTSATIRGTYTRSTSLTNGLLVSGTGGVAAGYWDPTTSRYWTFAHSNVGGRNVIRRAVHATLSQPLGSSDWSTVATATSSAGLTSAMGVESPGIAVLNRASQPMAVIDAPANGASVSSTFTVIGWATDLGAGAGPGVDAVDVYVYPSGSQTASFSGAAKYGSARADLGSILGGHFTNAGYSISVSGLASGAYQVTASGRSTVTGTAAAVASANVTVTAPASNPAMALDTPANGSTTGPSFTAAGWAVDPAASSGVGVDTVHVWAYPIVSGGFGSPTFLGAASPSAARPDVGAVYGTQFSNAGYSVSASGLALGRYRVVAYAHSVVTGTFNQSQFADVTVAANPVMAIDVPSSDALLGTTFRVAGWAADRAAPSGIGVDAVHVWAFPAGGGAPTFVGQAALGAPRADVGAVFGAQFTNCGYDLNATLARGTYTLGVYARSTVTGSFNAGPDGRPGGLERRFPSRSAARKTR